MEAAKAESKALEAKFEDVFRDELRSLAEAIQNNSKSSDEAISTAKYVTARLTFGFSSLTLSQWNILRICSVTAVDAKRFQSIRWSRSPPRSLAYIPSFQQVWMDFLHSHPHRLSSRSHTSKIDYSCINFILRSIVPFIILFFASICLVLTSCL